MLKNRIRVIFRFKSRKVSPLILKSIKFYFKEPNHFFLRVRCAGLTPTHNLCQNSRRFVFMFMLLDDFGLQNTAEIYGLINGNTNGQLLLLFIYLLICTIKMTNLQFWTKLYFLRHFMIFLEVHYLNISPNAFHQEIRKLGQCRPRTCFLQQAY